MSNRNFLSLAEQMLSRNLIESTTPGDAPVVKYRVYWRTHDGN